MKIMVIMGLCVFSVASLASCQAISPSEAAKHVGERGTVCGTIAGEHMALSSKGAPTFINLDKPYPNRVFTILIWGNERQPVGQFPTSGLVCAIGTITSYRGTPEIVLHDKESWYVPK
jgi:hypothetical protein